MSAGPSPTDEALYESFRDARDERALDALIARHWEPLYRLAASVVRDPAEAEDMAQEAFVRLIDAAKRGTRLDPVIGWLRTVVVNDARNALRARGRRERHEGAAAARSEGREASPLDPSAQVREYVEALPDVYRLPLVLHYGLGLTHVEVAAAMGAPASTASLWIKEGVDRLRRDVAPAGALGAVALDGVLALLADASPVPAAPRARTLGARVPRSLRAGSTAMLASRLPGIALALVAAAGLGGVALALLAGGDGRAPAAGAAAVTSATPSGATPRPDDLPTPGAPSPRSDATATASSRETAPARTGAREATVAATRFVLRGKVERARAGTRVRVAAFVPIARDPRERSFTVYDARFEERRRLFAGLAVDEQLRAGTAIVESRRPVPLAEGPTDDDGAFAIAIPRHPDVEAGHRFLVTAASADGVALSHGLPSFKDEGVAVWRERLSLTPLRTVEVVVRAGGPVAGARVLFATVTPSSGWWETIAHIDEAVPVKIPVTTDAGGRFILETGAVEAVVTAWSPGFAAATKRIQLAKHTPLHRRSQDRERPGYTFAPDGPVRVELDLVPEARLAGQVRDASGAPVAGAVVSLDVDEAGRPVPVASGTTGADGRYAFPGLSAGRPYILTVEAPDARFQLLRVLRTPPDLAADVVIPAGKLVVSATLEGRRVEVWSIVERRHDDGTWHREHDLGPGTETDEGVAFAGLPPGTIRVIAWRSGAAPAISEPFAVGATAEANRVVLALEAGRTVKGRIVERSGAAANAQIQFEVDGCEHLRQLVNAGTNDGDFTIKNVPSRAGRLLVGRPLQKASLVIELPEGRTDVGEQTLPP